MSEENLGVGVGTGIMLVKENKVLLGLRNKDPEKADSELRGEGTWTMPGGKLRYGESLIDCARREIMEETGIKVKSIKVIGVNNDKNEYAHFVTIGLFSDDFEGDPGVKEPEEITEWRWFDLDDLPTPLFFPSERVLRNYLEKRFSIDY